MENKLNLVSYEGIVNIKLIDSKTKLIKKSITVHNNGTKYLFYFLCNCLVKRYDSNYAPLALDASDAEYEEGSVLKSSLAYRIILSNQALISDVVQELPDGSQISFPYVSRFSGIIPSSAIAIGEDATLKCLQLHSSASSVDKIGSFLAWINIPEGISISSGEALLIEWNMGFQNPYILQNSTTQINL